MTTGTELSTLLTTYLHNDVSLSAADKLLYLNLGQKRIVRDAPTVLRKKSATLSISVAGDREYSLASDFYMMSAVWIKSVGIKLFPIGPSEFIDDVERMPTIASSYPTGYIILGYDESQDTPAWRIRFNKTPDTDYTVYYWYYYFPPVITAGSTPVISSIGYDELLLWAAAMIALQPKDPEGFKLAAANYRMNLESFSSYIPVSPDYTPQLREETNLRSIQRVQVVSGYDVTTALADTSDDTLGDAMIGYKRILTGSVGRTVHDHLDDEPVYVTDFDGVDPTGVSDSSTGIQAALDALTSPKKALYFPAGTYLIGTGLMIDQEGFRIFGDSSGWGSVIKAGDAIEMLSINPGTNYWSIENLTFNGDSKATSGITIGTFTAPDTYGASNNWCSISNILTRNISGNGITAYRLQQSWIKNFNDLGSTGVPLYMRGCFANSIEMTEASGEYGIYGYWCGGNTIRTVSQNGASEDRVASIRLTGASSTNIIRDSWFENGTGYAASTATVLIDGESKNNVITNNTFTDDRNYGGTGNGYFIVVGDTEDATATKGTRVIANTFVESNTGKHVHLVNADETITSNNMWWNYSTGDVTKDIDVDIETAGGDLYKDNIFDSVGIGTQSPARALEVYSATDAALHVRISSARANTGGFGATIEMDAPSSPAAANAKNFAIWNENTGSTVENYLVVGGINDNHSYKNRGLVVSHAGQVGVGGMVGGDMHTSFAAKDLPVYADNAAALVGGLEAGNFYRTSTGVAMVAYNP